MTMHSHHDAPAVYLTRRRPCWLCSRSLATVTNGENRGKYAARLVVIDGHERMVHELCFDSDEDDDTPAAGEGEVRG